MKEQLEHLCSLRAQKESLLFSLEQSSYQLEESGTSIDSNLEQDASTEAETEHFFGLFCPPRHPCTEHLRTASSNCTIQEHLWSFGSTCARLKIEVHSMDSQPRFCSLEPLASGLDSESRFNDHQDKLVAVIEDFQSQNKATLASLFFQLRRALDEP